MRISGLLLAATAGLAQVSCGSTPCSSQADCPVGSYCVRSFGSGRTEGACQQDCFSSSDCEQPESNALRAVCTNEGRCRTEGIPPRLIVLEPEPNERFSEGTQRIRLAGEVEMAAAQATVVVTTGGNRGCGTGISRQIVVENTSGDLATVPFVLDDVFVDPGQVQLFVRAQVPGASQTFPVPVEIECPGCAQVTVTSPLPNSTGTGLRLNDLQGSVDRPVQSAIWRVRGTGGVLDGSLGVTDGGLRFAGANLPLFPGTNRVEVLVTGVGTGLGETRCSILVNAGVSVETGLRAILTWDGATSDLDLHLVGDGGRFGDPSTTLSSRSRSPVGFRGVVDDDFDGMGPETLVVSTLPDGDYGLVVEAVFDDQDPGSTAFLRVLYDGQTLTAGPIGPQYLQAIAGDLWVAGVLSVRSGQAAFEPIDGRLMGVMPPTTPPSAWPTFF